MNARDNTPLRTQIAQHLDEAGESPAAKIAAAVGKASYPSMVVRELNAMRTDGLVECEQRGKKKELAYWLSVPLAQVIGGAEPAGAAAPRSALPAGIREGTRAAQIWRVLPEYDGEDAVTSREIASRTKCAIGQIAPVLTKMSELRQVERIADAAGGYFYTRPAPGAPQPAEGGITGNSASAQASTTTPAEGAAVQEPAPAAAPSAASASDDEIEMPQYDPDVVSFDAAKRERAFRNLLDQPLAECSEAEALQDMLSDARLELDMLREALGVPAEPHQSMFDRMQEEAKLSVAHYKACLLWERTMMAAIGEDAVGSVAEAIERLKADLAAQADTVAAKIRVIDGLRAELATERQASQALQEQLDAAQDVTDAAAGYLVKVPKRRPRVITKPERARAAALAAAKAAGRADVLALVPVGTARRDAVYREVKA